jgi:hypothetical protein
MSEVYYLGKGLCMRAEPWLWAGGWAASILLIFIYIKFMIVRLPFYDINESFSFYILKCFGQMSPPLIKKDATKLEFCLYLL